MNLEKMRAAAARRSEFAASELPREFAVVPEDRMIDLDVRDDLRNGHEPFSRIMAAQAEVAPGGVLRIRAIFEPVPLYTVLGKQGFQHWTERLAEDDWRVWFLRTAIEAVFVHPATALPADPAGAEMVVLDVRRLEPPEPMVRTLEALEQLPAGKALLQINVRIPQLLLPMLNDRGFEYVLMSETPNEVRGLIRRRTEGE